MKTNDECGMRNEKQKAGFSFQKRCLLLETENLKLKTHSSFRIHHSAFDSEFHACPELIFPPARAGVC
jgi:hypothetical protein